MPEPRPVKPKPQVTDPDWSAAQVKESLDLRIAGLERAVDVAREEDPPNVSLQIYLEKTVEWLQYYIERIMDEQRRGMTVAEQEREKTALLAEREREKAASALRIELDRAIRDGDRALRDHIEQQVHQINAALVSAEILEKERMSRASDQVDAERRVSELTRQLSDIAISKAEGSTTKQFDEFSKSIKDQMDDLRAALMEVTRRLDRMA